MAGMVISLPIKQPGSHFATDRESGVIDLELFDQGIRFAVDIAGERVVAEVDAGALREAVDTLLKVNLFSDKLCPTAATR